MTTNRPGRETSWVSRAPLAPMGFFVTWHKMVWPARSICSIRGDPPPPPPPVVSTSSRSYRTSPR